jgi:D-alanine-D-alanine ligase
MTMNFGKVAVLMGGSSGEREVSLKSGQAVLNALRAQGIDAYAFDPSLQSLGTLGQFDAAFICLHGCFGEDGTIQGALEYLGIPYTGSGVMASAIGMDKWRTKLLWQASGISTPRFELLREGEDFDAVEEKLGLPIFVKPANEGSSIGISKVKVPGGLKLAYQLAKKSDPLVLAEEFIGGGEYTVGILGDSALPIVKIVSANEFYDFEAKYLSDETQYICPSDLDPVVEKNIQSEAIQAFKTIGCLGWGRVDFLMNESGQHFFLEVNTSPGMTDHSLVPMAAKVAGMSFEALVHEILSLAIKQHGVKRHVG